MSRGLGKFVPSAPIRPARASVTYEVTLKFLVAAYTFVLAGPSQKSAQCLDDKAGKLRLIAATASAYVT
jgi:hypothetical protein